METALLLCTAEIMRKYHLLDTQLVFKIALLTLLPELIQSCLLLLN
jgi:hypothetical protein